MSYRYHDKKRGYSRSRSHSKSWSRDRSRYRDYRDRKDREEHRHKYNEPQKNKDERQYPKDSRVSIDWRPKKEGKYRHDSRHRDSPSNSSSSSSSSSYSSSDSRSGSRRHPRRYSRKNSRSRSDDRDRHRRSSRSRSQNRRQHPQRRRNERDEKQNNHYRKDQRVPNDHNIRNETKRPQIQKTYSNSRQSFPKPMQNVNSYPSKKFEPQFKSKREQKVGIQVEVKHRQNSKQKITEKQSQKQEQKIAQTVKQSKPEIELDIMKKDKLSFPQKYGPNQFPKPAGLPQPIKRVQSQLQVPIPEKQKISKTAELINQAKKNLEIKPLIPNFLMLDSFRTMKKFSSETLDPTLLLWLQRNMENNFEQQKTKVFSREIIITEERQSGRIRLPLAPTDQELSLRSELESLRVSMVNLNYLFRQLHMLE